MNFIELAQPLRSRPLGAFTFAAIVVVVQLALSDYAGPTLQSFLFLLPVTGVTLVSFVGGRSPAALTAVLSGLIA